MTQTPLNNYIAIFIFHKELTVCRNHLDIIKWFNPNLKLYGLFGGSYSDFKDSKIILKNYFEDIFFLKIEDPIWKKRHTDLSVRIWFAELGFNLEFDVAIVIQWDMLFFGDLPSLFGKPDSNTICLTGITEINLIKDKWVWSSEDRYKNGLYDLSSYALTNLNFKSSLKACLGPGYCLPKKFLTQYTINYIPEYGHDELRLPLYASFFGFKLQDNGFYPKWFDPQLEKFFNANECNIEDSTIISELKKTDGVRVFHPHRTILDHTKFKDSILSLLIKN